jgi:hypothetical protein
MKHTHTLDYRTGNETEEFTENKTVRVVETLYSICGVGNFAICWGFKRGSGCLHPVISKYPILHEASVPVVRGVGSIGYNCEDFNITTPL